LRIKNIDFYPFYQLVSLLPTLLTITSLCYSIQSHLPPLFSLLTCLGNNILVAFPYSHNIYPTFNKLQSTYPGSTIIFSPFAKFIIRLGQSDVFCQQNIPRDSISLNQFSFDCHNSQLRLLRYSEQNVQ